MSEPILLVGNVGRFAARLGPVSSETLSSPEEVRSAFQKHRQGAIWVAKKAPLLKWLVSVAPAHGTRQRLLLLVEGTGDREVLDALFERVVAPDDGVQLVKADDLAEILVASDRRNYFIGGAVSPAFKSLVQGAAKWA